MIRLGIEIEPAGLAELLDEPPPETQAPPTRAAREQPAPRPLLTLLPGGRDGD